jgi:hypothetical protein
VQVFSHGHEVLDLTQLHAWIVPRRSHHDRGATAAVPGQSQRLISPAGKAANAPDSAPCFRLVR